MSGKLEMRGSNPINLSNPHILCDKLEILKWCNIFLHQSEDWLRLGVIGPGFAMCYPLLPANTTTFSPPLLFISRNRKPAAFAKTHLTRLPDSWIMQIFVTCFCVCAAGERENQQSLQGPILTRLADSWIMQIFVTCFCVCAAGERENFYFFVQIL